MKVRLLKKGLTGIETAIILIAIVLVAAAFAFIVLNMGFGATQKAGEVITKGTKEAASSLEPAGTVLAAICNKTDSNWYCNITDPNYSGTNPGAEFIIIYVKAGVGAMPVDANKTAITFTVEEPVKKAIVISLKGPDAGAYATEANYCSPNPVNYTESYKVLACIVHGDNDNLIEVGEKWAFVINVTALYKEAGYELASLKRIFEPYLRFRVELKPPAGAVLTIERALPASITPVMETW